MSELPRMRPRFELTFNGSVEALRARLKEDFADSRACEGKVFRANASLWMVEGQRTYWSPYLNIVFEEDPESAEKTRVRGRFSPHPSVWTLFMGIYFALISAGIASGVYGFVEWTLHGTAWWMLGPPAAAFLVAFVFGASLIGQGLSADQMHVLRRVVEHACGRSGSVNIVSIAPEPAS